MDPITAFVIATLMMLLNGGVLGLMHRGLSADVQPSAVDWRIGTLLAAGGCVLLAVQAALPPGFILPIANGSLLLAMALYWRAVRRFDGHADDIRLFLPVLLGMAGVYWFAVVTPSLWIRVALISICGCIPLVGAARCLFMGSRTHPAISRSVLAWLFVAIAGGIILRGLYFVLARPEAQTILDGRSWINAVAPLLVMILPVIGTTAFLMLCAERIRGQWERAASTDYLTALPNRRTISGTGAARFNAAKRSGAHFAAAVIDIDHFKSINDRFGHDTGDLALRHVAALLAQHCRGPNMVGRQGGEEFVALLEDADDNEAHAAAERLRRAIEQAPFTHPGGTLTITVSIGIGGYQPDDREFDDLLRRADQALYRAKTGGRNRVA